MKKIKISLSMIVTLCILMACFLHAEESNESKEIEWSIQWQGLTCKGFYYGEVYNNKPNGTGEFTGNIIIGDAEKDELFLNGNWENGKLQGKGILINYTKDIVYEGTFKAGKLNGVIKEYSNTENNLYRVKNYKDDVPYGVCWIYNEQDEVEAYDYFFYGSSVSDLCETADIIDYKNLLYYPEEFINHRIKLQCQVVEILDNTTENDIRYLKVIDANNMSYILTYDINYNAIATSYVPFVKEGDAINVYGYYEGVKSINDEMIKTPTIKAVLVEMENSIIDFKNMEFSYNNFLNYPYLYENQLVEIHGVFKGIYHTTDKYIYFIVESDTYSDGEMKTYIGRLKNSDKNKRILPVPETEISFKGKLKRITKYYEDNSTIHFYPMIVLSKILE